MGIKRASRSRMRRGAGFVPQESSLFGEFVQTKSCLSATFFSELGPNARHLAGIAFAEVVTH